MNGSAPWQRTDDRQSAASSQGINTFKIKGLWH